MSLIEEEKLVIEFQMAVRVELKPISYVDLPFQITHQFHRYIPLVINNMDPIEFKQAVMNEIDRFDRAFEKGRVIPDKHWKHFGLYTDEFLNQISHIPERIRHSIRIGSDKTYAFQFVLKTGYNVLTGFNKNLEHYETDKSGNWNELSFVHPGNIDKTHIVNNILESLHAMFEDYEPPGDIVDQNTDWDWETYMIMGHYTG